MERTRQAVSAQLEAMGVARFELGVFMRAPSLEAVMARVRAGVAGPPLRNPHAERLAQEAIRQTAQALLSGEAEVEVARHIMRKSARMWLRVRTPAEILAEVPGLMGRNARGQDVYIRPQGSTGLVLVDDLTARAVAQLR